MLKIKIVAVGSVKSSELSSLCGEYSRRLRPFARVEVVEVAHEPFRDIGEKEKAQLAEAERILRVARNVERQRVGDTRYALRDVGSMILLEEKGREFNSVEFAKYLSKLGESGQEICFVIGGALGLHPSISLSPLTFPHEMARLILLEQIYRAATIMAGKTYHY